MSEKQTLIKTDLAIIGAGSGGLTVAAVAAQLGVSVALIEKSDMGGDCLNTGCVPSKALLAAAAKAYSVKTATNFGVNLSGHVDFEKVHQHIHSVIGTIAPHDSQERFESLGCTVLREVAKFYNKRTLIAGDYKIRAKRIIVATGSSAAVPPIPGLDAIKFLTNQNIFKLKQLPNSLLVLGSGPIGMEMAQAFNRLGSHVTVISDSKVLPRESEAMAQIVHSSLKAEGVEFIENAKVLSFSEQMKGVICEYQLTGDDKPQKVIASQVLVATGRKPNLQTLALDKGKVQFDRQGIKVDNSLRSVSNKRVYAIGDIIGHYQFTHMAGYQAGIVIRNALFRMAAKVKYNAVPWVTYTDPQLAHVGMTFDEAVQQQGEQNIRVLEASYKDNDRAQAQRTTVGGIKVIVTNKGKILGVDICGANADDLLQPWILAIENNLPIKAMASSIVPYPTLSDINKRAAGSFYKETLFAERTKKLVKFLMRFTF